MSWKTYREMEMSDSAAVSRIIFKSRLTSALLLLVSIGCFSLMTVLSGP